MIIQILHTINLNTQYHYPYGHLMKYNYGNKQQKTNQKIGGGLKIKMI